MKNIKITREITLNELKELERFAANQETTDAYYNTSIHVNGENTEIDLEFTESGDIILL